MVQFHNMAQKHLDTAEPGLWIFRIKNIIKDILTKSSTKALQFELGLIVSEKYM